MIDLYQLTAERVHNVPEGWKWHSLDCHNKPDGYIEVRGAVPNGVITRGPRKGSPKWPKEYQTLWMKFSDTDRVAREWEQENGKCHFCEGTGQETASVSVYEGRKTRACSRCNGTGKPKT